MTFSIDLTGHRALVTGAGQHTGREFALALAEVGAVVGVNDIVADKADAVVAEIRAAGGQAEAVVFDVTDHAAVAAGIGGFGPDILINNTGATSAIEYPPPPFTDSTPESWRPLVDINLYGVFNCTQAALASMVPNEWGRIITIISDAGRRGERGLAVYGAAKAGAAGFIRSISAEYGRVGITANCISFGTLHYAWMDAPDAEMQRRMLRNYAVKRQGAATDPVGLVLLLASDHASWISGQVIPVDGGYTQAL